MEDIEKEVNEFIERQKTTINYNSDDLKVSRSFSSGFGFTGEDRELRGESRPEVTVNVVKPWFNSVMSSYTQDPFSISARRYDGQDATQMSSILEYENGKSKLNDVALKALENLVDDGYAYILVDTAYDNASAKTQYSKPMLLDNGRVFLDDCEEANAADCQMAVYLAPMRKKIAAEKYDIPERSLGMSDPFAALNYIGKDTQNYTTIATIYRMTDAGCEIYTMVHGRQIGEPRLIAGATRIPIVRVACERVWIESLNNWVYRGAYWYVYDLIRSINYSMSLQTENVATAPTVKFLTAKGSFNSSNKQLSEINKQQLLNLDYETFDAQGRPIPPPQQYHYDALGGGLMDLVTRTNEMVVAILGSPNDAPNPNETAESVLLRKSVQESTRSRFLTALRDALEEVGRIEIEMSPMLFGVDRTVNAKTLKVVYNANEYYAVIDAGPLVRSQKQRSISVLLALGKLIQESPNNPVLPAIVMASELTDEEKTMLMGQLQPKQQIPPEIAQAMAAKDAQIQELNKYVSQLQIQLNEFVDDTKTKLAIAQMDNETKVYIKQMEIAADNAQLQQELRAEYATKQAELAASIDKERIKLLANIPRLGAPQEPVFSTQRTFV